MKIELRGSEASFRKLIEDISRDRHIFRDPGHPLANFVAEIEDQLEPNAERAFDFVNLDEDHLYGEEQS